MPLFRLMIYHHSEWTTPRDGTFPLTREDTYHANAMLKKYFLSTGEAKSALMPPLSTFFSSFS